MYSTLKATVTDFIIRTILNVNTNLLSDQVKSTENSGKLKLETQNMVY